MTSRGARSPLAFIIAILVLTPLVGVYYSCGDNPATVGNATSGDETMGEVDPKNTSSFELGSVVIDAKTRGHVEVWGYDLVIDSTMASFDLVLRNRTERDLNAPIWFIVTQIVPNQIGVVNADGETNGKPYFDFSDDLGDDDILSPDEETGKVKVQFNWDRPGNAQSFSLGFRIKVGQPTPPEQQPGVIAGVVFHDANANGQRDDREKGIGGVAVVLYSGEVEPPDSTIDIASIVGDDPLARTETNRAGEYWFEDLPPGIYRVQAMGKSAWRSTTPNPLLITLVEVGGETDSFEEADFGYRIPNVPEPPHDEIQVLFGPRFVGPERPEGGCLEDDFGIRSSDRRWRYYLLVNGVPTFKRCGPPDRIEVVVNGETVYVYECGGDNSLSATGDHRPCKWPGGKFKLPADIFNEGEKNSIKICVDGGDCPGYVFVVARKANDDWDNWKDWSRLE